MKIGIYIGEINQFEGGGFIFQDTIIRSLPSYAHLYDFFLFYYSEDYITLFESLPGIARIRLKDLNYKERILRKLKNFGTSFKDKKGALHNACQKYEIDILWYISYRYEYAEMPFIYTVWDLQHRLQPYFPEFWMDNEWLKRERRLKEVLPKASYVLTGTERGKDEIIRFYDVHSERIRLIKHPTPQLAIREDLKIDKLQCQNQPYVFYPAQFWAHKNHVCLIKALKVLESEYKTRINAILSGHDKGNEKFIKQLVDENGLQDRVFFPGFIPLENLIDLYQNAVALVFPTLFGPENLPPLEAMSLGCPAIVSSVPGSKEQFGDSVLYFNPFEESDLALQIYRVLSDKNLRKNLIKKGFIKAEEYSSNYYMEGISKIFQEFAKISRCWK